MNDYFESIKNKKLALRTYNILIGAVIAWGLGINAIIFNLGAQGLKKLDFKATISIFLMVMIIGVCLNQISDKFVENLIGLNLIVLSLGILFGMSMANFETTLINDAIVTTIVLTLLMICLAGFIPSFFLSMQKILFGWLVGIFVIEGISILMGVSRVLWLEFCVELFWCLYIGYNWAKSQTVKFTLNNIIHSVLYLNVINLLIILLVIKEN